MMILEAKKTDSLVLLDYLYAVLTTYYHGCLS